MFEPYRRDVVAKSLFRMAEILWGALFVSILFSKLRAFLKLATIAGFVILFFVAWFVIPSKSPKEDSSG